MTPHELVDLTIGMRSLELEIPLPPDRYLRALARSTIALEQARHFGPEIDRKLEDLEALANMYELVQAEARELLVTMGQWSDSALEYALEAAGEREASPWPHYFAACREQRSDGADDVRSSEDPHE